jgi:tetratricopeptide (TPR) repeat protein
LDKRNVGAYYIIGCAYEKLQEVEIAIENFTIVIELDPTHVNALLARGACLNRIGHCKEALDDYDNALRLDEEKGRFKKSRQERRRGGKAPISEEDLVKPHENKLKPLEVDASQLAQGQTEVLLHHHSTASIQKQGLGSVRTNEDSALNETSFTHHDVREQALRQADVLHSYGWEARKRQDFRKAIEYYNSAIELNPSHFKAIFNRGFAFDKLGDVDRAIRDYRQALLIEPANAFCYYNLGISLDKKGLSDDAVSAILQRLKTSRKPFASTLPRLTFTAIAASPTAN